MARVETENGKSVVTLEPSELEVQMSERDWEAILDSFVRTSMAYSGARREIAAYQSQVQYLSGELNDREIECRDLRERLRLRGVENVEGVCGL